MNSYFNIYQGGEAVENRPPISYKIREYFEQFVVENVFEKSNLVINGKWKIVLAIIFFEKGKYGPDKILLANRVRTLTKEGIKMYEIILPVTELRDSEQPLLRTIQLIYEAIKVFLTSTYKRITPAFMDDLWNQVDIQYLLSLPYPAPYEEQKYVGDKKT